jgi:hypothetical protein
MADQKIMGEQMVESYTMPVSPLAAIFQAQKKFGSRFCDFNGLSTVTDGENWRYPQKLEWHRIFLDCIFDELSEVLNWLPWKHWKTYKDFEYKDIEIRFELIDILHFIVSELLLAGLNVSDVFQYMAIEGEESKKPEGLAKLLLKAKSMVLGRYLKDPSIVENKKELTVSILRTMVSIVGQTYSGPTRNSNYLELMSQLLLLFTIWDMDDQMVYDYYMSKMKENESRQARGY